MDRNLILIVNNSSKIVYGNNSYLILENIFKHLVQSIGINCYIKTFASVWRQRILFLMSIRLKTNKMND